MKHGLSQTRLKKHAYLTKVERNGGYTKLHAWEIIFMKSEEIVRKSTILSFEVTMLEFAAESATSYFSKRIFESIIKDKRDLLFKSLSKLKQEDIVDLAFRSEIPEEEFQLIKKTARKRVNSIIRTLHASTNQE